MNKKIFFLASIFLILILMLIYFIFFYKNVTKEIQFGKNMSSEEIVDYILNISSYEATVTVEINSNKNFNKYILKQKYIDSNTNMQEVIEPENISGVKIEKSDGNVIIENANLNISTILEDYDYIADNCLDLSTFIKDYKLYEGSNFEETDDQIIMNTQSENDNEYIKYKTLYISKSINNIEKLEIKDTNQNIKVNILYNEVEIK